MSRRSRSRSQDRRRDSRRRSGSRERSRYGPSRRDKDDFGRDRHPESNRDGPRNGDGKDDLFSRRLAQRKAIKYSIWSSFPSPLPPEPSKKEKRPRTPSPPPSSSSEDEDERRRRKKKQSKRKSKSKKRRRQRTPSPSSSSSSSSSDDSSGDEAPSPPPRAATASPTYEKTTPLDEVRETTANSKRNNDDDEVIGPMPLPDSSIASKSVSYGKDLLPGEGAAIAQFVQKNMRIPRRGEVGWSGNEIEQLESAGYVMSGSRHQRMNAIRIRKENQVYSAEEKRALALINIEEKQQRENNILAEFREMLTERLTKKHGSLVVEERQDQHQASIEKDT